MPQSNTLPYRLMVLLALIQGLALLLLHQSIELDFWPHREPQWLFAFYSAAVVAPTMLLLGLESTHQRVVFRYCGAFTVVVCLLAYYVGSQAAPVAHVRYQLLLAIFVASICVASFKALMYAQHFASGRTLSYSHLFQLSWRNFLTLLLSLLFTLCVWGILMLWAGLFKAINIDFFYDLFTEVWFYYPCLALAFGFGVIIFRQLSSVIDTIARIQQALMKFLLVILVFVSVIFLAALPFTGLAPLWETGGSLLILWMQALMLFFVNAVYQDDPEIRPYPLWMHRFIYLGIALLPLYSMVSFYGLSLRVEQYGWTQSRAWAFLLWAVFALFSLGYLAGIARLRDQWLRQLSWVNVRMGLVVLALALLVNSPLLDFRKISVASQLARLDTEQVSLVNFDYAYFRSDLAKPGYDALMQLKEEVGEKHPEIRLQINNLYADPFNRVVGSTQQELASAITVIQGTLSEELKTAIYKMLGQNPWRMRQNTAYYLTTIDLNDDGREDYLLIEEQLHRHRMTLFYKEGDTWFYRPMRGAGQAINANTDFIKALREGDMLTENPSWKTLTIGGQTFRVQDHAMSIDFEGRVNLQGRNFQK